MRRLCTPNVLPKCVASLRGQHPVFLATPWRNVEHFGFHSYALLSRSNADIVLSRPNTSFFFCSNNARYMSSPSFINQVLEQVKRDIAENPKLKKELEDLRAKRKQTRAEETGERVSETVNHAKRRASSLLGGASTFGSNFTSKAKYFSDQFGSFVDRFEWIRKGKPYFLAAGEKSLSGLHIVMGSITSFSSKFAEMMRSGEDETARKRNEEWKRQMMAKRETDDSQRKAAEAASGESDLEESTASGDSNHETTDLVLREGTAWDKFGAGLKDMPFLKNFWGEESPIFGKILGETEQGAALRDMKSADPSFRLPEFVDLFEHVIAPHMLHCYLKGDIDGLRAHCGEAAFAGIESTIRERELLKLTLDPTVLLLRNVELQGITRMEDGFPWFIFTFSAQQINCMRNAAGKVVLGAIDDIREVIYSIAVSKHPDPESADLQYPWIVNEMAILGNTATW
eukprot:Selendium_serpulae@DN5611_c0_g1_i2.p1